MYIHAFVNDIKVCFGDSTIIMVKDVLNTSLSVDF